MIKATIQRSPYCTEMTFPCTETQLSTWLDELRMNPEHLCPAATITQIEPAELSILEDREVSLISLLLVITLLLPITTDFLTSYTAFADDISISEGAAAEEEEDYSEWLIKAGNWGDPIRDGLIPPWGYFHKEVQKHIKHTYSDIEDERTYSNGRADLVRDIDNPKAEDHRTTYIWEVKPGSYLRPDKMVKAENQLKKYIKSLPEGGCEKNAKGGAFGEPKINTTDGLFYIDGTISLQ